jgi:hypothetical protein
MLPTAQSSVNFVCGEGFRDKITERLTDVLVTAVIGVLKGFEKLSKSLRSPRSLRVDKHAKNGRLIISLFYCTMCYSTVCDSVPRRFPARRFSL